MKIDLTGGREQIDPTPIDNKKVFMAVIRAVELVIEDSEDYAQQKARRIFDVLSNDERIAFQTILKMYHPEGTRKTYWSCFKDHLKKEKEWIQN